MPIFGCTIVTLRAILRALGVLVLRVGACRMAMVQLLRMSTLGRETAFKGVRLSCGLNCGVQFVGEP